MHQFENTEFPSSDELFEYFRQHADDIEAVVIPVQNGMILSGPDGKQIWANNAGAQIKLLDGTSRLIHREEAERLINDGLLQRLRVKCVLFPLVKPSDS